MIQMCFSFQIKFRYLVILTERWGKLMIGHGTKTKYRFLHRYPTQHFAYYAITWKI